MIRSNNYSTQNAAVWEAHPMPEPRCRCGCSTCVCKWLVAASHWIAQQRCVRNVMSMAISLFSLTTSNVQQPAQSSKVLSPPLHYLAASPCYLNVQV